MNTTKKYLGYSSVDFLNDDFFMQWIHRSDKKAIDFWEQFKKDHPISKIQIDEAFEIYSYFKIHEDRLSLDESFLMWNDIKPSIYKKGGKIFLQVLKYAAIFILIFSSGALSYYFFQEISSNEYSLADARMLNNDEALIILADGKTIALNQKESEISYDRTGHSLVVNNDTISQNIQSNNIEEMNKVVMPYGVKSMITLSDGTKVWLNAGSQLVYPSRFLRKKRDVLLIGEAYFEVAKNIDKPFTVHTSDVNVQVLGTSFGVTAYPEDQSFEAVLVEGSVSVKIKKSGFLESTDNLILEPNQRLVFDKVNGTAKMKEVDVSLYTSWIDGMLKLEREDLCRVVRRLERYYDIKIQIKDPLVGGYKISGKLDLKNKPSEVLNIIQQTIPIDWGKQKNGDFFIVEPI